MSKTCRVRRSYRASTSDPLFVQKGDELSVGDRTSEWVGWIWCTLPSGKSGWVPEDFVKRSNDRCVMLRDYDAIELTVEPGAEFTILEEAAGWVWCTNHQDLTGWLPLNHLNLL